MDYIPIIDRAKNIHDQFENYLWPSRSKYVRSTVVFISLFVSCHVVIYLLKYLHNLVTCFFRILQFGKNFALYIYVNCLVV